MGIAFRIVWRNLPARFGIAMLLEKHDPPNRFRLFDTNHDQNQTLLLHSKRFDYARRATAPPIVRSVRQITLEYSATN